MVNGSKMKQARAGCAKWRAELRSLLGPPKDSYVPLHGENGIPIRETFTGTGGMTYHRGRVEDTESKIWSVRESTLFPRKRCLVCNQPWEAMSVMNPG